ncbi:MAG TPA: hypothetical protein PKW49_12385 [Paludibacteraceae bacterium]|jgi:hypothetical protein|nr:hypothetical protein [Prevotellaceae bacterium]HOU69351.1 hypothetical protein [Paludibacteraceae bacterium]
MEKKVLSFGEFVKRIQNLKEALSVQGIHYSNITCNASEISGIRESTGNDFSIDTHKLYNAYSNLEYPDELTTTNIKEYVGRVASPSLAILIASGIYKE